MSRKHRDFTTNQHSEKTQAHRQFLSRSRQVCLIRDQEKCVQLINRPLGKVHLATVRMSFPTFLLAFLPQKASVVGRGAGLCLQVPKGLGPTPRPVSRPFVNPTRSGPRQDSFSLSSASSASLANSVVSSLHLFCLSDSGPIRRPPVSLSLSPSFSFTLTLSLSLREVFWLG